MTTSRPLTDRQAAILDFIRSEVAIRGRPPTLREIGARFDIASTNGVRGHLLALVSKGVLKWDRSKSRTLAPVGVGDAWDALTPGERKEVERWIRAAGHVLTDRARDAALERLTT